MCGIVALSGRDTAARLYYGLFSLQHRGQDSCGILTYDNAHKKFRMVKGRGLVSDVFSEQSIENLDGNLGIGHVRYPTIGSDFEKDAQPFVLSGDKRIGMAHNGNIANYGDLVRTMEAKPRSGCDIEVMLSILGEERKNEGDIFAAVGETMKRLNGGYSVVSVVEGEGLVIFRDPHAIRPLVLSKHGAASESIALDIMEETVIDDVAPGECIVMGNGSMERKIVHAEERRHCMFEWVYFSRPDSTIEKRSVYEVRMRLGEEVAKQFRHAVDVVMPVPDTSKTAALSFSRSIGVPYEEGLIKNRYVGRTFIMPEQRLREMAVKVKLNPIISEIRGNSVALVDDSIVRGTTSKKLVQLMRGAGAKEVHLVIMCPPVMWPCFYGIDMTRKSELAAAAFPMESVEKEMAKLIGADSVTYLSIDGLRKAIGIKGLCTACLNGDYPTDVSALLAKQGAKRPYEAD